MFKDGRFDPTFIWLLGTLACLFNVIDIQAQSPDTPDEFLSVMPKRETQALEFLKKHPNYDGRNVVVAVLDTGVDPTADGLRLTPSGETKVIDIIDATGAGDVDMSTVVKVDNNSIEGIRGNKLRINPK